MSYENILRDFSVYVGKDSYLGKVTSYQPPEITVTNPGYRAGGLDAPIPIDMGLEALQATVEFGGFAPNVLKRVGLVGEDTTIVVRGALVSEGEDTKALVETLTGVLTGSARGAFTPGESSTHTITIDLKVYTVELDGAKLTHIDVLGRKRMIDGVDQLDSIRSALGI